MFHPDVVLPVARMEWRWKTKPGFVGDFLIILFCKKLVSNGTDKPTIVYSCCVVNESNTNCICIKLYGIFRFHCVALDVLYVRSVKQNAILPEHLYDPVQNKKLLLMYKYVLKLFQPWQIYKPGQTWIYLCPKIFHQRSLDSFLIVVLSSLFTLEKSINKINLSNEDNWSLGIRPRGRQGNTHRSESQPDPANAIPFIMLQWYTQGHIWEIGWNYTKDIPIVA